MFQKIAGLVLVGILFLASCAGTPKAAAPAGGRAMKAGGTAANPSDDELAQMRRALEDAKAAFEGNHVAEGARRYVAVLRLYDASKNPDSRAVSLRDGAKSALEALEAAMTIEPDPSWLDSGGNQVSRSTRGLAGSGAPGPAVLLSVNLGYGKAAVPDMPVSFSFVKGKGRLTPVVSTDPYGKANATVASFADPDSDQTIRASVVIRDGSFAYALDSVYRDFSFVDRPETVILAALQRLDGKAGAGSALVDPVVSALASLSLEAVPAGSTGSAGSAGDEASFLGAFGGDGASLRNLAAGRTASRFALILTDCAAPEQVTLDGKTYELWAAKASSTLRLLKADGSILYTIQVQNVRGQGALGDKAVSDACRKAVAQVVSRLEAERKPVLDALDRN